MDVKLLVDIRKASSGRPADLANWSNHCVEIERACMRGKFILSTDIVSCQCVEHTAVAQ